MTEPQPLLTVDDVAKELQMSPYTVRKYIRAGELPGHKIGRQLRVLRDDLNDYVAAARLAPALDARQPAPTGATTRRPPAGGYRRAARTRKDAA